MRKEKVVLNAIVLAISELISMICGLIVPRLILLKFGSEYNGIITSITQITSFVALLRSGVGGVTRAALYKPLAQNDTNAVSAIVKSTENFMRKIAILFIFISGVIAAIYPIIVDDFEWFFTFSLFMILCISTFIQYYFGITYQMLLMADQCQYIYTLFNIGSIVINTLLSIVLINVNATIHMVKLGSSFAYMLTPFCTNWYVKKRYKIKKNVNPDNTALKQRWDALGHQIANYVLNSTDMLVLTLFADIKMVSVYSIYFLVIKALKMIVKTYSSSMEAAFGNMIAHNENNTLNKSVTLFEALICLSCSFLFTCAAILILPFVRIYTDGINDIN